MKEITLGDIRKQHRVKQEVVAMALSVTASGVSKLESKRIQDQFLNYSEGGGHIKNLYLRDHKKTNFLLITEQDCPVDLKILRRKF